MGVAWPEIARLMEVSTMFNTAHTTFLLGTTEVFVLLLLLFCFWKDFVNLVTETSSRGIRSNGVWNYMPSKPYLNKRTDGLHTCYTLTTSNASKTYCIMKIPQAISRTTEPSIGLLGLILIHFPWWVEIIYTTFDNSDFLNCMEIMKLFALYTASWGSW